MSERVYAVDFEKAFPRLFKYLKKQGFSVKSATCHGKEVSTDTHYHSWTVCYSSSSQKFKIEYLHTALPVSQQSGYNGSKECDDIEQVIEFFKKEEHHWTFKSRYNFFQHVWRGLGELDCCGSHPGISTFWFMMVVAVMIGLDGGLKEILIKCLLMSLLVGIPLCYGAYERSKLDERTGQ